MEREALVSLVLGVQNGDDTAMTEMYNTFYDDIHYYIFKTVNDEELASDLTQDTFIEILQSIHSLQEPAAFITWCRQIAYRRCTAYFKKRHDLLVDEDEDGNSIFDTIPEDCSEFIPDEALDKEELKQTIRDIINELPEKQRSAIMMRYFDELSVAEIAKIQNTTEGTVKSRLNYGRKAIGKSVEDYEKKNNVKLHCTGVIPLLLWLLREYRLENGLSLTTGTATASGVPVVSGTATATTTTAVASTATVIATKTVGTALVAKIVACIVAVSLAVGGIAMGVAHHKNNITSDGITEPTEPSQSLNECNHDIQVIGTFIAVTEDVVEDIKVIAANAHDYLCKNCKIMNVTSDIQASDECNHIWQETEVECPYATYTRGHCQNCNKYSILEYTLNSCEHNWTIGEEESTCSLCGYLCKHNFGYYFFYTGDFFEDGLPTGKVKEICCGCGWQKGNDNSSE